MLRINKPQVFLSPSLCKAFEDIIDQLHGHASDFDKDCIMYCHPTGECYFSYHKIYTNVLYADYLLFGSLEENFNIGIMEKKTLIYKYISIKFGLPIEWVDIID